MAHPFHARFATRSPEIANSNRRTFLSWFAAATGGVAALLAVTPAQAQRGRTMFRRGPVTTQAIGEEGSGRRYYYPPRPPTYTTQALGEEGGRYTTYATGEEGGARITTYAIGEEGGVFYRPAPPPRYGGGTVTTFAIGEEG
jgi:hypothetical protein